MVENADPSPLLYSMDDILTGDVRDEGVYAAEHFLFRSTIYSNVTVTEVDPRLAQALKVAQLTAQYIVASNQLLQTKQEVIQKGIAAFDEEEERLDLELSKLRCGHLSCLIRTSASEACKLHVFVQGKVSSASA